MEYKMKKELLEKEIYGLTLVKKNLELENEKIDLLDGDRSMIEWNNKTIANIEDKINRFSAKLALLEDDEDYGD